MTLTSRMGLVAGGFVASLAAIGGVAWIWTLFLEPATTKPDVPGTVEVGGDRPGLRPSRRGSSPWTPAAPVSPEMAVSPASPAPSLPVGPNTTAGTDTGDVLLQLAADASELVSLGYLREGAEEPYWQCIDGATCEEALRGVEAEH